MTVRELALRIREVPSPPETHDLSAHPVLVPLFVAVLLGAGAHALHQPAASRTGMTSPEELPSYLLPEGDQLRPFTLGHATTVSDFYWLREIQYLGTPAARAVQYPQLLALGDLVTDLDPLHGYAYQVTGLMLAESGRYHESNQIFDKGRTNVPDRWELPFFEAFNEYYELQNFARGAELLRDAARIPGSPAYVPRLASKLYAAAGEVETALGFVETMLAQPDLPEEVRQDLEDQRFGLQIEGDSQRIEAAIAAFARRHGRHPSTLHELEGTVIDRLPVPPAGGEWLYYPRSGRVRASIQEERLRYRRELEPDPDFQEEPQVTR